MDRINLCRLKSITYDKYNFVDDTDKVRVSLDLKHIYPFSTHLENI